MTSSTRLNDKIAILLGVLWVCFAISLAVELSGHAINETSDSRSQMLRRLFIAIYLFTAAGVLLRFTGWRWVVVVPCVLIAIRDYFLLLVPRELHWDLDQVAAAVRLAMVIATIALAALWGRFRARVPDGTA